MKLTHLELKNFRNITESSFQPGPHINLFCGPNGSGKTSLLEAIHYLGLGRSFRTRNLTRIISYEKDRFSLFGHLAAPQSPSLTLGLERKSNSQLTLKKGGAPLTSFIELAKLLPLQLINADSHLLLTSGPLHRRQFLDWGVFHMDPAFYPQWQRSQRLIKQRNAHLKTAREHKDVAAWDNEFATCAEKLDSYRASYITQFETLFLPLAENLLERRDITLNYNRGWDFTKSFHAILESSFRKDVFLGYTQFGPQRADVQIEINKIPAGDVLSQGQQKLITYALRLAQGQLMQTQQRKDCLFLIDDLPSELDSEKRKLISGILQALDSQLFITGIDPTTLIDLAGHPHAKMFHVEHGLISNP